MNTAQPNLPGMADPYARIRTPHVTLRWQLRGNDSRVHVTKIAWSPDGQTLAVPTQAGDVEIWKVGSDKSEKTIAVIGNRWATNVAWSPDGRYLAVGTGENVTRVYSVKNGQRVAHQNGKLLKLPGNHVAWVGKKLFVTAGKNTCNAWASDTWQNVGRQTFTNKIVDIGSSSDGRVAVAARDDGIHILAGETLMLGSYLRQPQVRTIAWSPDARLLATGESHGLVSLFDTTNDFRRTELERHTRYIRGLSFSADGGLLASKSDDGTVIIWNFQEGAFLSVPEPSFDRRHFATGYSKPGGLAFHPSSLVLATLGNYDRSVRVWDVDLEVLSRPTPANMPVSYTTAKIVLVGDSGVGKTGLGWRLSHQKFKEHTSTHGQQFWVVDELRAVRPDGTECEAVLWDLAGQADYRLTHALFLDRADLALIVFDAGNHNEPLKGVEYWLNALKDDDQNPTPKILVAARCDRAVPTLTQAELDSFAAKHNIIGGFVATSALRGDGIPELLDRMKSNIPWQSMTTTVTTATFKRVKENVLALKESVMQNPNEGEILIEPARLLEKLQALDPLWELSEEEMMTAVRHLENHGYLALLQNGADRNFILLAPEILSNLASSIVLEARRNPNGLGALEEARALRGDYALPELQKLDKQQRDILLDAVIALFIRHNICFRERLGSTTFLIFPSLINQKKPTEELGTIEDVSYWIRGRIENVYAALVVLLGYSNTFTRTNQWHNQAQYEMNKGEICGFRQIAEQEGEIELVHYYSKTAGQNVKLLFQGLFETFLLGREVTATKFPAVFCPNCGYHPDRAETVKRIKEKKDFLFCGECAKRITLPGGTPQASQDAKLSMQLTKGQVTAAMRTVFETALVKFKGIVRGDAAPGRRPSCFVSYAWGVDQHERWVLHLVRDLQNADMDVLFDRKDNAMLGSSIADFVNSIEHVEYIVVVGTPEYLHKYNNKDPKQGTFVAAEMDMLNQRLTGTVDEKKSVLPLLLAGDKQSSLPPLLRGSVYANFQHEEKYFSNLFDLILTMYGIDFDAPGVYEVRQSLWEND